MTIVRTVHLQWADEAGEVIWTQLYVKDAATVDDLLANVAELAECAQDIASGQLITALVEIAAYGPFAGAGNPGLYSEAGQRVRLNFETVAGPAVSFACACPLDAVIGVDGVIDEQNADVAALIAAYIDYGCDKDGREIAEFTGGNLIGTT